MSNTTKHITLLLLTTFLWWATPIAAMKKTKKKEKLPFLLKEISFKDISFEGEDYIDISWGCNNKYIAVFSANKDKTKIISTETGKVVSILNDLMKFVPNKSYMCTETSEKPTIKKFNCKKGIIDKSKKPIEIIEDYDFYEVENPTFTFTPDGNMVSFFNPHERKMHYYHIDYENNRVKKIEIEIPKNTEIAEGIYSQALSYNLNNKYGAERFIDYNRNKDFVKIVNMKQKKYLPKKIKCEQYSKIEMIPNKNRLIILETEYSPNKTIKIVEIRNNKPKIKKIIEIKENILSYQISLDNKFVGLLDCDNHVIHIMDINREKITAKLKVLENTYYFAFSPDGQFIATIDSKGIKIWRNPAYPKKDIDLPERAEYVQEQEDTKNIWKTPRKKEESGKPAKDVRQKVKIDGKEMRIPKGFF